MPSDTDLQNAIVAESHGYWHSVLRQTLPECGLDPLMKRSAEDAIIAAEATPPRLIVFGALLPDMDSMRAWGVLRRVPCCESLPVIILARWFDPKLRELAVRDGATLPLLIPLSLQELRHGIIQLLGEEPEKPVPFVAWPPRREPKPLEGGLQGLARGSSWRRTNYSR